MYDCLTYGCAESGICGSNKCNRWVKYKGEKMKKLSELVSRFDAMDIDGTNLYPSLTKDQQQIHDDVIHEYRTVKYSVLDARSGSGKTTTIRAIVKTAESLGLNIEVTATTGKASSALGGKTIHSYLGLKMTTNDNATNKDDALFLKGGDTLVDSPDILIIDEASMIGTDLLSEIKKHRFNYVLFVLDSNQLPPVKAVKVEWNDVSQSQHYLTKTLRAQDPHMVKLFNDFKDFKDGKLTKLDLHDYVNDRNIVKIDYADCDFIPKNSDSCSVSYRNKLVEFMANKITIKGHNKYNLNASVGITKMVSNGQTDRNGYAKRDFVNETVYYNGEDVQIDLLTNETTALQKNGYCMYKNWKLSLAKSGNGISVTDIKSNPDDDTFYIKFPVDEVLEHCTLAIIEQKYFILIWDSSEDEYKQMLDDLFMTLRPYLTIHQQFKKYVSGKIKLDECCNEIRNIAYKCNDIEAFKSAYEVCDISSERKNAWGNFLGAKSIVSARFTTSRTVHKSQGISVPCIVLTNNSFYGASIAAQYVAVTRGKHGIILIENVPNIIKEDDNEEEYYE